MPIAEQVNPTTPTVPTPQTTQVVQSGVNSQTQQHRSSIQRPWRLRLSQTGFSQAIPNSAPITLGLDTEDDNTYQALAGNLYTLKYSNFSYGGHNYPFSFISVPVFGYYRIYAQYIMQSTGTGAVIETFLRISVNGVVRSDGQTAQVGAAGDGFVTQTISDVLKLNPNDQISFVLVQLNSTAATVGTDNSGNATYANIAYEGPS